MVSEDLGSLMWKLSRDVVLQCGLDDVVMLLITAYLASFQKPCPPQSLGLVVLYQGLEGMRTIRQGAS